MKKVLSMDGGGLFGIIPAIVVAELEKRLGKSVSQVFDLVAGTSAGGINTLALTKPHPISGVELINFYKENGDKIFTKFISHKLKSGFGLWGSKYPHDSIEKVLSDHFGDTRLDQALTEIVIPAYDIGNYQPLIFNRSQNIFTIKAMGLMPIATNDMLMWEVARSTSAAPYYFPPYRLFIDGSVVANNPADCAYAFCLKHWPGEEIIIISVGADHYKNVLVSGNPDWGILQWGMRIVQVFIQAGITTTNQQLKSILGDNFIRVKLPTCPGSMDNIVDMFKAESLITKYVKEHGDLLDTVCEKLK